MSKLLPLILIMTVAWILVLLGSLIIFSLIVPLEIPRLGTLLTSAVKILLATILSALWILIMIGLRDAYMKRI